MPGSIRIPLSELRQERAARRPALPRPLGARTSPPLPRWLRQIQDGTSTVGQRVQQKFPGIKPVPRSQKDDDPYRALQTITIRCSGSTFRTSNTVLVHSRVVLGQSAWFRDAVAEQEDPEDPVHTPPHIKWWHVALALEYMYYGRVPGFDLLAGEKLPARYPWKTPRSIAVGLIELWQVGDFFGLRGLKERANVAFTTYMSRGIRHAIRVHGGVADDRFRPMVPPGAVLVRLEDRISHEFFQAAWKVFCGLLQLTDYMKSLLSYDGNFIRACDFAQDEGAVLDWEGSMFDRNEAEDDEYSSPYTVASPDTCATFQRLMVDVCMCHKDSGLFELRWFRAFVIEDGPALLREALDDRMMDQAAEWLRHSFS
ncbi:hypothetical protein Daus18300_011991 [Diaporthe australafricana]|uniref:BTB domain-containing protein n=1 Tax=Diaporthe australafricana TaxID=127596 RepID=A0ABR3W4J2_9PEZI